MTYAKGTSSKGLSESQLKDHAKSLGKDNVSVEIRKNGKYRLNITRAYSKMYYGVPQKRIDTGLSAIDANSKLIQANNDAVATMVQQMHVDLLHGYFDVTLIKYGLGDTTQLEVMDGGKSKPQMSILEVYDMYCDYKKPPSLAETTYKLQYRGRYLKAITKAIEKVGENTLDIRNFLIKNNCLDTTICCLSILDKGHQLAIRHQHKTGITNNPFVDMASELRADKGNEKIQDAIDSDESNDTRTFTVNEMNAIIEAFETKKARQHYAPIIKFLFWVGCRTGEAIGLKWRDIDWDKECIYIRRTYNERLKLFKGTKTKIVRWFPMPKNGKLWNLLKSLPERSLDDVVFTGKTGKIIDGGRLSNIWRGNNTNSFPGVIPELIKEGKVNQYLKLYATRHTFVTWQVQVENIPETTVAQWVGHDVEVSRKSYLDRDRVTVPGYSGIPTQQTTTTTTDNQEQLKQLLSSLTAEQIQEILKAKLQS